VRNACTNRVGTPIVTVIPIGLRRDVDSDGVLDTALRQYPDIGLREHVNFAYRVQQLPGGLFGIGAVIPRGIHPLGPVRCA
jgi:hypothetical protein